MGITIVYPIGTASARHSDILRYSIRSICKFNDVEQVIVIGEPVPWFTGLYIPFEDRLGRDKLRNVVRKASAIAKDPRIPEDFWWMGDDIFQTAPWDGLPHHSGFLSDGHRDIYYDRMMQRSLEALYDLGIVSPKAFFTHHPCVTKKSLLREVLDRFGHDQSYQWQGHYHNIWTDGNTRHGPNAKVHHWTGSLPEGSFLSSDPSYERDRTFLSWLEMQYFAPSPFEGPSHGKSIGDTGKGKETGA